MNSPEQPKDPWESAPPAQSGPPASPEPSSGPASSGPDNPPPPADPYTPPPQPSAAPPPPPGVVPPAPYGPPVSAPPGPYGPPVSAPPGPYGQPGPYGPPPFGAYGPPVSAPPGQPGPYGPPPGQPPYGPPVSAPPGAYGQPGPYGQPAAYGQPGPYGPVTWPGASPPPSRTGRTIGIVLGVTVPVVVLVCALVGLFVVPRVLDDQQASPSSPTPSLSEEPLAVPAVGDCYVALLVPSPFNDSAEQAERVACDEEHMVETIAVGELADSASPPDQYSLEARQLYRECEQAAQEYLGMAWRSTYTWLVLSVPSRSAWADGARWYRCDLTVNEGFYQTRPARTTGNLRGNAEPITCLTWYATESSLMDIEPSECDVPHQGELAGVFLVPEGTDYSDEDALTEQFADTCEDLVLDFLGTSEFPDELTFWFGWPNEDDFDQWVLCLVAASEANRAFTDSVRGVGTGPIPFA